MGIDNDDFLKNMELVYDNLFIPGHPGKVDRVHDTVLPLMGSVWALNFFVATHYAFNKDASLIKLQELAQRKLPGAYTVHFHINAITNKQEPVIVFNTPADETAFRLIYD